MIIGYSGLYAGYDITLETVGQHDSTAVEVIDPVSGDILLSLIIPDVYRSHYHCCEYHDGCLYVIRRLGYEGYPDEDWSDQLWRYSGDGSGIELYSSKGIDFRVSDDNRHIAVVTNESVQILGSDAHILGAVKTGQFSEVLTETYIFAEPLSWTTDGESFWLALIQVPGPVALIRIDLPVMDPLIYDISHLQILDEYSLQPDSRLLAFSDYPAMHCSDELLDYESRGDNCHLFVYDLDAAWIDTVASYPAWKFDPGWISPDTLEYNDYNTGNREFRRICHPLR